MVEHHTAIRDLLYLRYLQGVDQDGLALLGQLQDQLVDLRLGAHVNTLGGVIHDKDIRLSGEPPAQDHLLLVAAGQ